MWKTGCNGDNTFLMNLSGKLITFILLANNMLYMSCRADEIIKPHKPTQADLKIIEQIAKSNINIKEEIENEIYDHDKSLPSKVLFSSVSLEKPFGKEISLLIEYTHGVGQAGFPLYIFKNVNKEWIELGGHDMMDDTYFIVKPEVVNGYRVIQFPREMKDYIFNGKYYECPTCPEPN